MSAKPEPLVHVHFLAPASLVKEVYGFVDQESLRTQTAAAIHVWRAGLKALRRGRKK